MAVLRRFVNSGFNEARANSASLKKILNLKNGDKYKVSFLTTIHKAKKKNTRGSYNGAQKNRVGR